MINNCKKHPWFSIMKTEFPNDGRVFQVKYHDADDSVIEDTYFSTVVYDIMCTGDPAYWREYCNCEDYFNEDIYKN